MHMLKRFAADEQGATAVEYGLLIAGIAIAIVVAVSNVGSGLNVTFSTLTSDLATLSK
jgi:pilus assembly protein Flp/PilA